MSFGISAFSESPFASESGVGIQVSVTGVSTATTVGSVTITAIQNPTVAVTGIELTGALGQAQTDPDVIPTGLASSITLGPTPVAFQALANAQISTDQSKFGGSSLELDGTGDRIQSEDITLGTDSYTWETFVRYKDLNGSQCLWDAGENVGASQNPVVYITPTNLQLSYAGGTYINEPHGLSVDTWHHIAIVRDGTTLSAYVDGTRIGTATYTLGSGATNHVLGGNFAGTFTSNAYLDESRLTKRVVYTGASFTVPTAPFTSAEDDQWILHYDGADGSTDIVNSVTLEAVTVAIDVTPAITGQDLTITQGEESVVVDVDVDASGQNLTSATGSVSIAVSQFIDVTGQELTGTLETPSITGDANLDLTGSAMTITQGEEFAFTDVTVEVTGQSVGTVAVASVSIDLNTPVDLTGNQLNTALNNPFIQSWNAVDPDVANTWTDVDLDVANNWTDVDIAA